eukprot:EG_transcript_12003
MPALPCPEPSLALRTAAGAACGFVAAVAVLAGAEALQASNLWAPSPALARSATTAAGPATVVRRPPITPAQRGPSPASATVAMALAGPPPAPAPSPAEGQASTSWAVGAVAAAVAGVWGLWRRGQRRGVERIALMTTTAGKEVEVDYDPIIAEMLATEDRMMKVAVAKYMPVLKPAFFSKLEAMAAAAPAAEKKRYEQLADKVFQLMKAIVSEAQVKVQEQGVRITGMIGIFTEEDGTIRMPLEASRVARLREVVRKDLSAMSNEVFVNATLAFMAKAAEDKKTEAIEVLQRILQVYAAESLLIMCPHGGEGAAPENIMVWNMLLNTEFDKWEDILKQEFFGPGAKDVDSFLAMLDAGVGAVVYEQSKGSIQQILAQYVFQIIQRINKLKEATPQ